MKLTMTLLLYFLGMMVFIIWQLSDEEEVKEKVIKPLMADPNVNRHSTRFVSFVVCILLIFFSFAWPYFTFREMAVDLRNLYKPSNREGSE